MPGKRALARLRSRRPESPLRETSDAAITSPRAQPQISLIIPALNEAETSPLLLRRIAAALAGRPYEVLIVDDNSKDATPQAVPKLGPTLSR